MAPDEAWRRVQPLEQVMLEPYAPRKPDIITVVFSLAAPVSLAFLRQTVVPRLLRHPRFSSVLTSLRSGSFRFTPVPGFSPTSPALDHHLREEPPIARGDAPAFTAALSALLSAPLDRARPLWRAHLFAGSVVPAPDPTSTVVLRVHHSLSDGIGLLKYFLAHIADRTAPRQPEALLVPPHRALAARSPRRPLLQCAADTVADLATILKAVFVPEPPSALTLAPVAVPSVCALRAPAHVTVASLKRAAVVLGVTINDLLLGAFAGATRAYLEAVGDRPDELRGLRVAMPFNRHMFDQFDMSDVSNQLVMLPLPLPAWVADRAQRLDKCADLMSRLKRGYQPALAMAAMRLLVALPTSLRRRMWHRVASSATAVFSNVPGPRERLQIGGVDVTSVFFFPPPDVHVSLDVGIFSYAGEIFLGVAGDANRLKDPEKLLDLIVSEVDLITEMSKTRENANPQPKS